MINVAIREIGVLVIGCVLSFVSSLMLGNANRNVLALVAAIFLPIAFCLIRASLVKQPDSTISGLRHAAYQLCLGLALVLLLLFEMSVGLFLGAVDIPMIVWMIVGAFGIGYVSFFCLAFRIGMVTEPSINSPNKVDVGRFGPTRPSNRYADEQKDVRERPSSVLNGKSITPAA